MIRFESTLYLPAFAITTVLAVQVQAHAISATGSIAGAADPGAQIVVTSTDDGKVIDVAAKCDGTYRVDGLKEGKYEIVEGGPNHAVRKLSVSEGKTAQVNLGSPRSVNTNCRAD